MDEKGQLYALVYAILDKGLEHPLILVLVGGPWNESLPDTKGQLKFLVSQKLYLGF